MGFFNKILKGLGFEEEEEKTEKVKPVKTKEKKEKLKPEFASFDLNKDNIDLTEKVEDKKEEIIEEEVKPVTVSTSTSLDIIKVTNQVEVQRVVDKLKNGEQVIVNMSGLSASDLTRSLDFLTGAVYALNRSMQKVDEAIFIIS